jgi:hypothetical protein
MGIKIMMPPDVMTSIAESLIVKHVIGELVRNSVKTESDQHYLTIVLHKGISSQVRSTTLRNIAKLLSCPTSVANHHIAEHFVSRNSGGQCTVCQQASTELRGRIQTMETTDEGKDSPSMLSVILTFDSVRTPSRLPSSSGSRVRSQPFVS